MPEWNVDQEENLDIREEAIAGNTYAWWFKIAEENQALFRRISLIIPIRPADGMNPHLSRMASTWHMCGIHWRQLNDTMGGFIEATRGKIAHDFLHMDADKDKDFLIMIDNDMEPPLDLPYLLARHEEPVVGACAMTICDVHGPQLCFSIEDTNGEMRFPARRVDSKIPAMGLKKVGHVGTGALCIRRDVLESFEWDRAESEDNVYQTALGDLYQATSEGRLSAEEFREELIEVSKKRYDIPFMVPDSVRIDGMRTGRLNVGEDIYFCNQVRAKGYDMYVDLEAHCGHRKTVSMSWDNDLRDAGMSAENWVLEPKGKILKTR